MNEDGKGAKRRITVSLGLVLASLALFVGAPMTVALLLSSAGVLPPGWIIWILVMLLDAWFAFFFIFLTQED